MTAPYLLEREQWVPASLDQVFRFFSDAANLELLTPAWLRFQILTPQPIHMSPGTWIDYRLHWHGIPMRWRTEITVWQPPHAFEDMQLKGPYKLWHLPIDFTPSTEARSSTIAWNIHFPLGLSAKWCTHFLCEEM